MKIDMMAKNLTFLCLITFGLSAFSQALIIDHKCTDITQISQSAIENAKSQLHIAYGHTSHGSQITDGMSGLIDFSDNGGKGLSLPENIFAWNSGGTAGALDLRDYAMDGDVGYYPQWYDETVNYLENDANADVNVIMWSWCGQVNDKYSAGLLWDEYLAPMRQLEEDYPEVTFIYMTGHLEYATHESVSAANDSIRSFCRNNGKILFDFADIESYGPDGTCYKDNADDACNYYNDQGDSIGNWAIEYQGSHVEGFDWYSCGAAHSQPYNANLKAYAAWWMFARMTGWIAPTPVSIDIKNKVINPEIYPNPVRGNATLKVFVDESEEINVNLLSVDGKIVVSNISYLYMDNNLYTDINAGNLSPGIYYLCVISNAAARSYKLIVSK
jgi:hypothetical protein